MKMNKLFAVLLTALFLTLFFNAYGESAPAFSIDGNAVFRGMDRSWNQGYEPSTSRGKWEMILPVRSGKLQEPITAELVIPEGRLTPFKAQDMTVQGKENEEGLWEVKFTLSLLSNRKNSDFPCIIRLSGKDENGRELTTDIPYTVEFRGSKEEIEKNINIMKTSMVKDIDDAYADYLQNMTTENMVFQIDDINQLFPLFGYKKVKRVWLDRVAPQGAMFRPYNILYAWYYFGAKRPEAYVKSIETRHMNRIMAA